jgi:hypothetical protein
MGCNCFTGLDFVSVTLRCFVLLCIAVLGALHSLIGAALQKMN